MNWNKGSADSSLAVHCLHGGRHRQRRRGGTEEVHSLTWPLGGVPSRLAIFHRSVLVRAAVRHEVANPAAHSPDFQVTP